jgi:CubicO group peptidase (beta-lactamase class C family)
MINMNTIRPILCALCASSALAGPIEPASTNRYAPVIEKYTSLFEEEAQKLGIVGMGVALVDERGAIWARAFGYEDLEKKIPATTDTLFGIGSMTKVFTATALMQLQSQQAVDIDQPMRRFRNSKSNPGLPTRLKSHRATF